MKQILLMILCASLLAGAAFALPCAKKEFLYGPTDGSKDNVLVYYYRLKGFTKSPSGYCRVDVIYNDNDYAVRVWWGYRRMTPVADVGTLGITIQAHGCYEGEWDIQYEEEGDLQITHVRRK